MAVGRGTNTTLVLLWIILGNADERWNDLIGDKVQIGLVNCVRGEIS